MMDDFSGVSQGCRILSGTEDFKQWGFKFCLVGANSVILPGVTIGEGAVIGAGAVVSKNLEPWGIYLGNRRIGKRQGISYENL